MQLNPYGEYAVLLAASLVNQWPDTKAGIVERTRDFGMTMEFAEAPDDHHGVRVILDDWLGVVDASTEQERASCLNAHMASVAAYPRVTDHNGEGWYLHYRDADQALPLSKVILLIVALLGATALVALLGPWFALLRYIGAAWLIWLAFTRIRRSFHPTRPVMSAERSARRAGTPFVLGAALTLGNPLALTFYFAILPSVIPIGASPWDVAPTLTILVLTIMGTVIAAYALLAQLLLRRLNTHSRAVDLAAAGLLTIAALMIVLS